MHDLIKRKVWLKNKDKIQLTFETSTAKKNEKGKQHYIMIKQALLIKF
jgi:hypothetical protein